MFFLYLHVFIIFYLNYEYIQKRMYHQMKFIIKKVCFTSLYLHSIFILSIVFFSFYFLFSKEERLNSGKSYSCFINAVA